MSDDKRNQTLEEWYEEGDMSDVSSEASVEGEDEFPAADIALVVDQADASRGAAVAALRRHGGDLVDAILELVD